MTERYPVGSTVRFKSDIEFAVQGWDGEHYVLVPVRGDLDGTMFLSPDLFEPVIDIKIGSVWRGCDGTLLMVVSANDSANTYRVRYVDGETYMSRGQLATLEFVAEGK